MNIKKYLIVFLFIVFSSVGFFFVVTATSKVTLEIRGIGVRHGTPDNLSLGNITYSNQEQEITGVFNDYFWIEDLMGIASGHYTTIQCDGLFGPNGSIITGIYIKAGNSSPVKISGNPGNVLISNDLLSYKSIYNPLVYIYKTTNNYNIGKANKYGDIPTIKIIVPPETTPGEYTGTITFSLYME